MARTLQHSPARIMQKVLIALGAGGDSDLKQPWPVFAASEPDMPDNCITLYDTASMDDGRHMVTGEATSHKGLQIRVRSKDHTTGYARSDEVFTALEAINNVEVTIDTIRYVVECATGIGRPLAIGQIPNSQRRVFTVNCMLVVRELA